MKKWYQSKTVWFNIVTTIVGVVTFLQGQPTFAEFAPWLVLVAGIGNLILRIWFTDQPIV